MFILNPKKNCFLTSEELATIKILSASCGIKIYGVKIIKNTGLSWKNNITCFSVMNPNSIFICDDMQNMKKIMPHIAHELKHREQLKRMGAVRYLCLANPIWRKATIEPEAYAEEKRVELELNL